MRILLDECVHAGVKAAFRGHAVHTVTEVGWRGSTDGSLLRWAQDHFEVFVTVDRKLAHQQNIASLQMGFVMVRVRSNELRHYQPLFDDLQRAAENVRPGELLQVPE